MTVTCLGCYRSFKQKGLKLHVRRSKNPHCKASQATEVDEMETEIEFPVDPAGDFFGQYQDYGANDFAGGITSSFRAGGGDVAMDMDEDDGDEERKSGER